MGIASWSVIKLALIPAEMRMACRRPMPSTSSNTSIQTDTPPRIDLPSGLVSMTPSVKVPQPAVLNAPYLLDKLGTEIEKQQKSHED
jgi:hypothetical protein